MKPIRQVLNLAQQGESRRAIARISGISRQAVEDYLARAKSCGLTPDDAASLDDHALEYRLFPRRTPEETCHFPQPNWQEIALAMKAKGATLLVLHEEYLDKHPEGMKYARFCQRYKEYRKSTQMYMRFDYQGGDIGFVDYAGPTIPIYNQDGDIDFRAQIFVGVLGASRYIYADATRSQQLACWLGSHTRMYEAWGGTPKVIVCDNLKSGVTKAHRYEPEIQAAYSSHARHYGVEIIPARAYKPKDKALAERSVQLVERWILFKIRNQKFTSLTELNQVLKSSLEVVNAHPIRRIGKSRRELFELLDQHVLRPLPARRYEHYEDRLLRVGADYHFTFEKRDYSVPSELRNQEVRVRVTESTLEVYSDGTRYALHARNREPGRSMYDSHMPPAHSAYMNWDELGAYRNAGQIGPNVLQFMKAAIAQTNHIDHKRRVDRALAKMAEEFSDERLDRACARAIELGELRTQFVRELLRNKRENAKKTMNAQQKPAVMQHDNLRSEDQFNEIIGESRGGSNNEH